MKLTPIHVLILYVGLVLAYAGVYYSIPDTLNAEDLSFIKSLYFSMVTITTLGYGDITPQSDLSMMITGSESMLGMVIVGLFLSSLWQSYRDRLEKDQARALERESARQNMAEMAAYFSYLVMVLDEFEVRVAEVTLPKKQRSGKLELNREFTFSDMQDLYEPSHNLRFGFSAPVIDHYFDALDNLRSELKFVLANFDLTNFQNIRTTIIAFLRTRNQDCRSALKSYQVTSAGSETLQQILVKLIKEQQGMPELDQNESSVLTPAILLFSSLQTQIAQIDKLRGEIDIVRMKVFTGNIDDNSVGGDSLAHLTYDVSR
ncbi:two pore domain potassium channel family protein [Pseudomaricurvus alkylphenolicus]|uniref:potassium channel family protein n=1 Tax=Pseudomaricurvus alkylphenolicus TaxID=1306991 RepID=UPI001422CE2D|nr:potassium channel family protein [Pseudomaricurvus alkylphenolicus]NIB43827.1 two pore domain potassium channel family protein [Pseudomaricurvus alkylphenolicus]